MAHARQQIREAVLAAVTGLATTGANVFVNKITPQEAESLPNLLVYTNGEQSEADAMGASRGLMRSLDVVIDATAAERERKSWEPLLLTAAPRGAIPMNPSCRAAI